MKKIDPKILCQLISETFQTEAITEHRFGAELAGGAGKGLRERLKAIGVKDWRFDVYLPEYRIAVELEGSVWQNGRHTRGAGFIGDISKYNCATVNGIKLLRYTHTNHAYSDVIADLRRIIDGTITYLNLCK
jgi:hypothetical protein